MNVSKVIKETFCRTEPCTNAKHGSEVTSSHGLSQIGSSKTTSKVRHGNKAIQKKVLSSKKISKSSKKKSSLIAIMESETSTTNHSCQSATQTVTGVSQRPNRLVAMLAITGADLNNRDGAGLTPLHTAVIWGRLDLCQLLLDSGADPNSSDSFGRTPLQLSSQHGYNSVSCLLISRGGC